MKNYTEPERINQFVSIPIFTGSFGSGMASWLFHCDSETQIRFGVEYSALQHSHYFLNVDEGDSPEFQFHMAQTRTSISDKTGNGFNTKDGRRGIYGMYYEHVTMPFQHTVSAGTHWMNLVTYKNE